MDGMKHDRVNHDWLDSAVGWLADAGGPSFTHGVLVLVALLVLAGVVGSVAGCGQKAPADECCPGAGCTQSCKRRVA